MEITCTLIQTAVGNAACMSRKPGRAAARKVREHRSAALAKLVPGFAIAPVRQGGNPSVAASGIGGTSSLPCGRLAGMTS